MTNEEKLDAFIAATNERLERMEAKLDGVVNSLTIPPDIKAQMEAMMERSRQQLKKLGYPDEPQSDEI